MPRYFQQSPDGRLLLTDAAQQLSNVELQRALEEAGCKVSRTTVWRARKRGWCVPGYHEGARRIAGDHLGWVGLTKRERQLGPSEVARRFGIDPLTARRAIDRGWFSVTRSNAGNVTVAKGRIRSSAPPPRRDPVEPLVPAVIRSAPDGRLIADLDVAEIVSVFGLSVSKAAQVRRRGEIRTRGWPLAKRRALARLLERSGELGPGDAEKGE